jgi:hypothetical protein
MKINEIIFFKIGFGNFWLVYYTVKPKKRSFFALSVGFWETKLIVVPSSKESICK